MVVTNLVGTSVQWTESRNTYDEKGQISGTVLRIHGGVVRAVAYQPVVSRDRDSDGYCEGFVLAVRSDRGTTHELMLAAIEWFEGEALPDNGSVGTERFVGPDEEEKSDGKDV